MGADADAPPMAILKDCIAINRDAIPQIDRTTIIILEDQDTFIDKNMLTQPQIFMMEGCAGGDISL